MYEAKSDVEDARFPFPEPSDITQAALINFDDTLNDMKKIKRELEGEKNYQASFANIFQKLSSSLISYTHFNCCTNIGKINIV